MEEKSAMDEMAEASIPSMATILETVDVGKAAIWAAENLPI
uniref:Uncharacterized protein n=1 Tax=viral metagenome TaxID=1070528 RepID=A0A6C0KJ08_9ZZZZ